MGYADNSVGGQILSNLGSGSYNVDAHGDLGAFYNSISHADLPKYTAMFYQQSEHEAISDVKYSKIEVGYDQAARAMIEHAKGAPIEAYMPVIPVIDDSASASPGVITNKVDILPKKTIVDEILKAQAELLKDSVIVRTTQIEEQIVLRRSLRKIEIFKKKEEQ